jgi:zinc D-Ala-D-Ala carboxypeptidase
MSAMAVLFRLRPEHPGPAARTNRSPVPTPTQDASPPAVLPLPACIRGRAPALDDAADQWNRTLLDTRFALPRSYVPPDLVSVSAAGFDDDQDDGALSVRSIVLPELAALRRAAAAAGAPVAVEAAYRSYGQQAALLEERTAELGESIALERVAQPGHSEHQLGTTLDFKSFGATDVDQSWVSTPAGRWMLRNAAGFGFVLSYPEGSSAKTCYAYEPWHYRYVGPATAAGVVRSNLTLREYLWDEDRPSVTSGS